MIAARLSPEGVKRRTLFERFTVARLSWDWLVRSNRWLAFVGKIATGIWVAFCASVLLGVDLRNVVEHAINSGKPVAGAVVLVFVIPTVMFLLLRSVIGFMRWRMQRELWRRETEGRGEG